MKKLFLFIVVLVFLASGCATQQGTLFGKSGGIVKTEIPPPPMQFDINELVERIEALEKDKQPLTLEQIRELATQTGTTNFYGATALTGGGSGSADSIDGTNLATGDGLYVITSTAYYIYYLNATSGAGEASPDIISPDDNAGEKRWILIFEGDPKLADIAQLTPTDGNVIVGDGATWVAEGGNTARTSLGLGTGDSPTFVTTKLSGLGNGFIPYHIDDATGFGDSPVWTDGTDVGVRTTTPAGALHTVLSAGHPAIFGGDTIATLTAVTVSNADPSVLTKVADTATIDDGLAVGDAVILNSGTNGTVGTYWVVSIDPNVDVTLDRQAATGACTDANITYVNDPIVIEISSGSGKPRMVVPSGSNSGYAFGGGDTKIYEESDDILVLGMSGAPRFRLSLSQLELVGAAYPSLLRVDSTSTSPNILPERDDIDTGIGHANADQLSLIAGGVEGQRMVEANSVIYNLFGVTEIDGQTDQDSTSDTNLTSSNTATYQVDDAVLVWSGTEVNDYGLYYITAIPGGTDITLDRALTATHSDIDYYVLRGGMITSPQGIRVVGNTNAGTTDILNLRDSDETEVFAVNSDGDVEATSVATRATSAPATTSEDSDADVSGRVHGKDYGNLSNIGDGTEDFDRYFQAMLAGSLTTFMFWDASEERLYVIGKLTVKPDGTNEVFAVKDGTLDFTDGAGGTTGTLTIDSSGHMSYNKNFAATNLDGIIGSNTPAAANFTTIAASDDISPAAGKGLEWSDANLGAFRGIQSIVWRMITHATASNNPLVGTGGSGQWEISDEVESEIGTPLGTNPVTEATGIFSFGSTGYWIMQAHASTNLPQSNGVDEEVQLSILSTNDNSTYSTIGIAQSTHLDTDNEARSSLSVEVLLKVTSIANDKVKIISETGNAATLFLGSTTANRTYIVFTKLADL